MINQTTDVGSDEYAREMYEALIALEEDKNFKKLFVEGYFTDEAARITGLLSSEYVRQNGIRPLMMEKLVAISSLQQHLALVKSIGAPVDEDEE